MGGRREQRQGLGGEERAEARAWGVGESKQAGRSESESEAAEKKT